MPSINRLHNEFANDGLTVLLVDVSEPRETVARAVARRGYTAQVLLDSTGQTAKSYRVRATPTTYLVSREGEILGSATGSGAWTSPAGRALVRALLKQQGTTEQQGPKGSGQVSATPTESRAPSSAMSTTTKGTQPRLGDDQRTVFLLEEVREPRSKRQPELSLGSDESGQTRHITLAGDAVAPPRTVVIVCGDFVRSVPLTHVSQPSERRVAVYRVSDDVVDTMLRARSCYLSVVPGHLLQIPPESLSTVWASSRTSATRDR